MIGRYYSQLLELPRSPLEAVMAHEVWSEYYDRLTELIGAHRTTLVFVNTRRMAERVARHEEENMRKLISILVATAFALSSGAALAASHAGAQPMKDDKKSEMKKGDKKPAKKAKKAAKKDEMKK